MIEPNGEQEILDEWQRRLGQVVQELSAYDHVDVRTREENEKQAAQLKAALDRLIEIKIYQSGAKASMIRFIETSLSPYRAVER